MRARVSTTRLDRQLADGVCADANPALALRAQVLTEPSVPEQLGGQLRRIVHQAHQAAGPSVRVRPDRERVLAAEDELRRLASRLQAPRPVAVLGVAKVRLLLTDGCGPLFYRGSSADLGAAIREATLALS